MKLVILMRNDLNMSVGKMVAQAGHAVAAADEILPEGCAIVALQVSSAKQLEELTDKALRNGIDACRIQDAGRTEVPPGTFTCGYIGPALDKSIDKITGQLKLL